MKKFIVSIFLFIILLVPATSFAETKVVSVGQDWYIAEFTNDFTDNVIGALITTNSLKFGHPGICILHEEGDIYITFYVNGNANGKQITYRVDKNTPVTIDISNYGTTLKEEYLLLGERCTTLIEDFKKGKTVVYEVKSSNIFIGNNQERISLVGFTKLFNKLLEYGVK